MYEAGLKESLCRYIGTTVTIFTTSGGLSGCGFTGVLAGVGDCTIKLITDIGIAPTCPVGSSCGGCNNWGMGGNYGYGSGYGSGSGCGCGGCCDGNNGGYGGFGNNWLGSVTEIPICAIASFTHNAI